MPSGNKSRTRVAYLFPGQGAQSVGMGSELYKKSAPARSVFDMADEVLGFSLSRLCFDGPEDELQQTVNTQPAIFTVSLAVLAAFEESLSKNTQLDPELMAGHSLGEYTALVAAKSMDFATGLRLVRERGRLMQDAGFRREGAMGAVLGLDELTTEEICRETGAQIANLNSDDQIVISGDRTAIANALDLAQARGARRVIPLRVSGAFHSSLMEPARDGMVEALRDVTFYDPAVPIVANTTAKPFQDQKMVKDELLNQLTNSVQWHRSLLYMIDSGIKTFLEIGPGRVLTGLAKRLSSEVQAENIEDLAEDRFLLSPPFNA